jgi:hypothetical protein
MSTDRSLDVQLDEYRKRRFIAVPIAGMIMWAVIGVLCTQLSPILSVWALFIGTGSIVGLGLFLSKFTGENLLDKSKPKNAFDSLFMHTVVMALLTYAIAIPFFLVDYTSLPMTVGILTGLMWVPLSWSIQHWVGIFHTVSRTVLVLAAWYLYPEDRFVVIPFVIVAVYLVTIVILERRYRDANSPDPLP